MEEKSKYTKTINWKQFYRNVFALVIPIAIQNLINVGVTATDVIMLGKVGEKVLSGASLAGQIQYIMTLIFYGVTSGATVLTAQYWGKKDTRTIEKVLGMGLSAGLIVAVVFAGAALGMPETLMRIYTSDPEVIAEGVKYLRIVGSISTLESKTIIEELRDKLSESDRILPGGYIYLSDFIADEYCGKCDSDLRTIWIPGNGSKGCGNRYAVCQSSRDSDGSRLCHLPK